MQTRTPSAKKKFKSYEIATLRKGKTQDGKETRRLVFAKDVKIFVGNQEVDLGEYNMAYQNNKEKILADLDFKVEKGWMTEEQAAKAAETVEEKQIVGSFTVKLKE